MTYRGAGFDMILYLVDGITELPKFCTQHIGV